MQTSLLILLALGPILWWGARTTTKRWETEDGISKRATLVGDVLSFLASPGLGALTAIHVLDASAPAGAIVAGIGWLLGPLLWPMIERRIRTRNKTTLRP